MISEKIIFVALTNIYIRTDKGSSQQNLHSLADMSAKGGGVQKPCPLRKCKLFWGEKNKMLGMDVLMELVARFESQLRKYPLTTVLIRIAYWTYRENF